MGSTISMTCCSTEEIVKYEDENPKPVVYTYPDHYLDDNIIHKSYYEITKLAIQDN